MKQWLITICILDGRMTGKLLFIDVNFDKLVKNEKNAKSKIKLVYSLNTVIKIWLDIGYQFKFDTSIFLFN